MVEKKPERDGRRLFLMIAPKKTAVDVKPAAPASAAPKPAAPKPAAKPDQT
jgi:hypothetical protein